MVSVGDAYRSKTFLGYTDEGIAFCSPTSDANEGGDYQAFYLYPGAEVAAAGALKTSYIFSNNGARRGDGALVYLILPAEVGNWTASCAGYNGATCPAALTVDALRAGQPLPAFPAGGFVVITVQGTAPVAPGANSYAAAIAAPSGAPDYLLSNNVPVVSQTVVKAPVICAWVLNPATLALPNSAQTAQTRIATNTSCRWSITADQPWLTGAPLNGTGQTDLSVSASANAGIAARSGTITLTGLNAQGQPIAASAATVRVVQTGTPATPVNAANPGCADSRVAREGDQFGSVGITGSSVVNLVVDTNCAWTSKSNAVWISVVKGSGGSGNAEVGFQVAENPGTEVRKGTVSIANRDFTVTQMGTSSNRSGSSGGCGGSTGGCGESGADGGGGGAGSGGDGGSSGGDSG